MPGDSPLTPHGGYSALKAYRNAEIIFDATVAFCQRFFRATDRTVDQMVQAARSGKQNIAEGSSVSGTSRASELKLTGVARASLEELLTDFRDFLRRHDYAEWDKDNVKCAFIRRLAYRTNLSYGTYRSYIEEKSPETSANTVICLIKQTCYLLDQLKRSQAKRLVEEGGINERIHKHRRQHRGY